jgi:hypothetical protein
MNHIPFDRAQIIGSNEIGFRILSTTGEELLMKYVFEDMIFL